MHIYMTVWYLRQQFFDGATRTDFTAFISAFRRHYRCHFASSSSSSVLRPLLAYDSVFDALVRRASEREIQQLRIALVRSQQEGSHGLCLQQLRSDYISTVTVTDTVAVRFNTRNKIKTIALVNITLKHICIPPPYVHVNKLKGCKQVPEWRPAGQHYEKIYW